MKTMPDRLSVKRTELLHHLAQLPKAQFAAIVYEVDGKSLAKAPKRNGLLNDDGTCRIRVRTRASIKTGYNYTAAFERATGEQAGPLPWGEWLVRDKVIIHKGEMYWRWFKERTIRVIYYLDGFEVGKSEVEQWLKPLKPHSGKTSMRPRNVKFSNILAINAGGKEFTVE